MLFTVFFCLASSYVCLLRYKYVFSILFWTPSACVLPWCETLHYWYTNNYDYCSVAYSVRYRVYRFSENPVLFCGSAYKDAEGLQLKQPARYIVHVVVFGHDHKFICVCDWWECYKLRHCYLFSTQSGPTSISTPKRIQSVYHFVEFQNSPHSFTFTRLRGRTMPRWIKVILIEILNERDFMCYFPYVPTEGAR